MLKTHKNVEFFYLAYPSETTYFSNLVFYDTLRIYFFVYYCSCEMLLSSARLNSGVQMSTRNSCKTLKCPQCNWHYKYQETLEIHMREKHPDGESACGYCLAGKTCMRASFQYDVYRYARMGQIKLE